MIFILIIIASLICQLNGQFTQLDPSAVDLETMPLVKLLEMKKALRQQGMQWIQFIHVIYKTKYLILCFVVNVIIILK